MHLPHCDVVCIPSLNLVKAESFLLNLHVALYSSKLQQKKVVDNWFASPQQEVMYKAYEHYGPG